MNRPFLFFALVACLSAAALGAFAGCADAASRPVGPEADGPDLLYGAMQRITDVMTYDIFSPPQASRVYAYASVAGYEAVAATRSDRPSLAGQLTGFEAPPAPPPEVHGPTAALYATLAVGEAMTFSADEITAYRADAEARLGEMGVSRPLRDRSQAYGEAVAQHVLAWAATDGYAQTRSGTAYTVHRRAGHVAAHAAGLHRRRRAQLGDAAAVRDRLGGAVPAAAAAAVLDQARDGVPRPGRLGPARRRHADRRGAHDCQLLGLQPVHDAHARARHVRDQEDHAGRPLDGHRGDCGAGSTATTLQPRWRRLRGPRSRSPTALSRRGTRSTAAASSVPRRSSTRRPTRTGSRSCRRRRSPSTRPATASVSGAAAEALTALYGDGTAFVDSTEVAYGLPVRSFSSFRLAADEAAVSRLYGGIHYPMAVTNGLVQGRAVGAFQTRRLRTRGAPDVAQRR